MILILKKDDTADLSDLNKYGNIIIKSYYVPKLNERDIYEGVFILGSDNDDIVNAWVGTPHLRVCKEKSELLAELEFLFGVPVPLEIERKYLVKYPDIKYLESLKSCAAVEITQTYIEPADGEKYRVRKRGNQGNYTYFHTVKRLISGFKRVEEEKIISEYEYESYLNEENAEKIQLSKIRYCLLYGNKYFEIDVFPFWDDKAYIEIELKSEDEKVILPPFIELIKDVSTDRSYTNLSLAKIYGKVL